MNDTRQPHDGDTTIGTTTDLTSPRTRSTILTTADGEPSLGDLVMGLTDDISVLIRKEVDLAKTEMQESVKESAQAGGMVGAGGAIAYAGLLFILAAIAIALGDWLDNLWLGAAIVGLVTALLGWLILNSGMNQLKKISLMPRKTMHSLERDAAMAKEKFS
jgi:hypothetical protein